MKYGFTVNHAVAARIVLSDGSIADIGASEGEADAPGYDLMGVFVGSEGLLGIVTEVVVRILRKWPRIRDGWSRGLAAAVALAAMCSIDDIDLNVPAVAALAALALCVLWGRALSVDGRAVQEPAQ